MLWGPRTGATFAMDPGWFFFPHAAHLIGRLGRFTR